MVNQLVTIAEAAALVNKSAQTIRRLIKNDQIKSRRKRTPQGFNYMVDKASLLEHCGMAQPAAEAPKKEELEPLPEEPASEENGEPEIYVLDPEDEDDGKSEKVEENVLETLGDTKPESSTGDSTNYGAIMEKLIDQHQSDKERLYALVEAFQNRVVTLEEQIKLLQAPKKRWWQVWK